jgi:hypothetical protein
MRCAVVLAAVMLVAAGCGSKAPPPGRARVEPSGGRPAVRLWHRYAVLVNADAAGDHKRNIARAYRTLRTLGFGAADIFVLSPRDRRTPPSNASPVFKPFPEHLVHVLDELEQKVEPGDLVVFYGTGHGDTDEGESLLELRRGELFAGDLRDEVDHLRGNTVVVMDQCYSGGFSDALEGTAAKVLVVTTVDRDHLTYCGAFARAFWDAFLHPERYDTNRDGKTSVREAFAVAAAAHHADLDGDPELRANAACRSFNGLDDALLN